MTLHYCFTELFHECLRIDTLLACFPHISLYPWPLVSPSPGYMQSFCIGLVIDPLYIFVLLFTADGIAMGAAATMSRPDVQMIVFIAIMLHKVRV